MSEQFSKSFSSIMDLGCLDMGCIDASDKKVNSESVLDAENKGSDSGSESIPATSKIGKNKNVKETGQSVLNSVNKSTSQIKKPSHRSPINWFPRQKVDSFLKRKIKMLQEVAGMNSTLDETLIDTNPHYSKVLKEKMAAREAANRAIEARKAALVEASWCRILKAARIQRKEAESQLLKAEEVAAEAFEAALAIGVNMYDIPNCPQKPNRDETLSSYSRETTHGVTASFETAFEVDKEVAVSVKTALIRLANSSSFKRDEFKDLLRRISQNPDTDENGEERSEDGSPNRESKSSGSETDKVLTPGSLLKTRRRRNKRRQSLEKKLYNAARLVDMMSDRLERLQEEELSSLTTIVATCGLSAALAEIENNKLNDSEPCVDQVPRRMSTWGVGKKASEPEILSLDKCLVKHVTRLEREVYEAKNKNSKERIAEKLGNQAEEVKKISAVGDLGSVLTNKHSSKLEKEIKEAKKIFNRDTQATNMVKRAKEDSSELPSLDKFLVKRVTRFEKEVQEAKDRRQNEALGLKKGKENGGDPNVKKAYHQAKQTEESLESVLAKPVYKLQKEKTQALESEYRYIKPQKKPNSDTQYESLDKVLVKNVSKMERDKTEKPTRSEMIEEAKDHVIKVSAVSRRELRERELQEAWGGLGLGNSMKPHLSRLERDKAAWIKADEEERKQQATVFSD